MSPFKISAPDPEADTYLTAGTHEVTIDEVEEGMSSGGHPQLAVTFKNSRGASIRAWFYPTRAAFRVQMLWEAAGLPWPDGDGEIDEGDLLGRRLVITVTPEEYNGVTRDKVTDYQQIVGSDIPVDVIPLADGTGGDDDTIPFLWDGPREYAARYHAQRPL